MSIDLTTSYIGITALIIFVLAYLVVMIEEFSHLRKSKPVIISAALIWGLIAFYYAKLPVDSSVVEHAPGKVPAIEMQDLLREVHRIVQEVLNERTENLYYSMNGVFNQSEKNNQAFVREFR